VVTNVATATKLFDPHVAVTVTCPTPRSNGVSDVENAPWLLAVNWPTFLPSMETSTAAPGAHPRPLMTVGCPGTRVTRLSWSVVEGGELDPAVLGAGGVRPAVTGTRGVGLITTVIPVLAESPVAPLATIVCGPGVVSVGTVTCVEKEPLPFDAVEPRVTPWLKSVRVIDSSGTKFWPVTVKAPPGDEIEELVAITAPRGPSSGLARAVTCQPNPMTKPAVAHATMNLRLMATSRPTPLTVADNTNSR
jgi:hypothetical protein